MLNKNNFSLRPLEEKDKNLIRNWRNSDHVRNHMYQDHFISLTEHDLWFKKILHNYHDYYRLFMMNDFPLGLICANQVDLSNSKCYWGFYLGELNTPAGMGSILEFFALSFLFEELNMRKICGEVLASNTKVLHLHKKFGFLQEGYLRNHVKKNDIYVDVITIAMFSEAWFLNKPYFESTIFTLSDRNPIS